MQEENSMPEVVKKAGSWVSLSVIATSLVTSLSLAMLYFFGGGVVQARETKIEVPYIIKSVDHISMEVTLMSKKIDQMAEQRLSDRLAIMNHSAEMQRCKERMANCEDHVQDYHQGDNK